MQNVIFRGTIAQAVAANLAVNGHSVGQPELSILTRLGIAKAVGFAPRPVGQKGKAATIWEVYDSVSFAVGLGDATTVPKVSTAIKSDPVVVLSDTVERSMVALDDGDLESDALEGVWQDADGTFHLSEPLRAAI